MYAEAFHRVLKHSYLKGKRNKRLDKLLHILLRYARDKAFDRIIKLEKGKTNPRTRMISKRHNESEKLSFSLIVNEVNNSWTVQSSSKEQTYCVNKEEESCPFNCLLKCNTCDICVHMYSCTCYDAVINGTICKHIHFILRYSRKGSSSIIADEKEKESALVLTALKSGKQNDSFELKQRLQSQLAVLGIHIERCYDFNILLSAQAHIDSALTIIKSCLPFLLIRKLFYNAPFIHKKRDLVDH